MLRRSGFPHFTVEFIFAGISFKAEVSVFELERTIIYDANVKFWGKTWSSTSVQIFLSNAGYTGGVWLQRYSKKNTNLEDPFLINAIGVAIEMRDN